MNAITRERHEELKGRIEPLLQQVEHWRKTKGKNEKMPEPLWKEAIGLAKVYGVSPVQMILRIDYRGLERRALGIIKPAAKAGPVGRPSFIELPSLPARRAEHLVELEDGTGRKLSLKIRQRSLMNCVPGGLRVSGKRSFFGLLVMTSNLTPASKKWTGLGPPPLPDTNANILKEIRNCGRLCQEIWSLEMHGGRNTGDVETDPASGGDGRSGDRDDSDGLSDTENVTQGTLKRHAGGYVWETQVGGSASARIGFWGATPVVQPSGADQAAVTLGNADREIAGLTISDPPTQAEVQALRDACEELADDVRALAALADALRGALANSGLIKGGVYAFRGFPRIVLATCNADVLDYCVLWARLTSPEKGARRKERTR